jgi:hypothetical protein
MSQVWWHKAATPALQKDDEADASQIRGLHWLQGQPVSKNQKIF